jgi:hypothetical protein
MRPNRPTAASSIGAIESAKKALIHDHVSHSLERSFKVSGSKGQAALRDFKLIAKYL